MANIDYRADNLKVVHAEEVLRKIGKGEPAEYDNVIIIGDLDLCNLDMPIDKNGEKIINSIIRIEYSVVKGHVVFDHSIFSKLVDFDGTIFSETSKFSDSQFNGDAGFSEAQFCRDANFSRTRFRTEANFSRARFSEDANFGDAKFDKNLNLDSARIYTMRLSDATFGEKAKIYLKDSDFSRLTVRWDSIKDHIPYNGSAYLALTKNFRNLEQFEDADNCYYQYRKEKQVKQTSIGSKLLDHLAWFSCGYSVRPLYTVLLSIMTIIFFTCIFWSGNAIKFEDTANNTAIQKIQNPSVSLKDAFYFSSMQFIGKNPQGLHADGIYGYLIVIEGLLGWLFMALFLVTLSKVMLR